MPPRLQIQPEDCSALGKMILRYLQSRQISMNQLAEEAGIPQPRLRGACLRGTCPAPETLRKLARAMGTHHLELYSLAYPGRLPAGLFPEEEMLETVVRELLATARQENLAPPAVPPDPEQYRQALRVLGFGDRYSSSAN